MTPTLKGGGEIRRSGLPLSFFYQRKLDLRHDQTSMIYYWQ